MFFKASWIICVTRLRSFSIKFEGRTKELLVHYFSTDDADIQLINASDLFKEFGVIVEP